MCENWEEQQEHRHLLELSSQQRAAAAAVQKAGGDRNSNQAKLFGLNFKHLRLLSQQNQQLADFQQSQDPQSPNQASDSM